MDAPLRPFSLSNIPPEIISQLFLAYHATLANASPLSRLRDICLTCRDWRDIAYSTPELWSTIDLYLQENVPTTLVDNLRTLLTRSREYPLTVLLKIRRRPWSSTEDQDRATNFMNLLLEHVHRWRIVHFDLQCDFFPYLPEVNCDRRADILKSLQINTPRSMIVPRDLITMLAKSPELRTWRDFGSLSYVEGLVHFKNLVNLHITLPAPPSELFKILRSLPPLKYLNTLLDKESNPPGVIIPVFSMLKSLKLSLAPYSSLQLFFSGIHVPNLDDLEFGFPEFSSFGSHMKNIKKFLETTGGQITSFSIRNMCIPEEDLLECLAILSPNLEKLGILADPTLTAIDYYAIENITERTIEALMYSPEQEPLCPRLDHLTLERCIQTEDGALSDMVKSRWRPHPNSESNPASHLHFLRVVFRYHTHPVDASRLRHLQAEGLDCQIRYGSIRASDDPIGLL